LNLEIRNKLEAPNFKRNKKRIMNCLVIEVLRIRIVWDLVLEIWDFQPGWQTPLRLSVPDLPFTCQKSLGRARVVEWQTRTFEGRMPKGMRVQVPPRAPIRQSTCLFAD
jgi:hypothetical protein